MSKDSKEHQEIFQSAVIYQVYPKSFCDSTGSGTGDIKGIISKLDYLENLGVNYIWFNPIFSSPGEDNGYDVANYYSIDPMYGTMEDVEELIKEAGQRGIYLMFDMVFNHTSTECEWFKKAIAGDLYYQDFYIFKNGSSSNTPPNNWQSKFGGSAWEYIPQLDKYYLHLFSRGQADLNWDNPAVREECAKIVNFWIAKGIKGFRFDVVNLLSKNEYSDDPYGLDGRQYYTDGKNIHKYIHELNEASFGQFPEVVTVGEMSSTTVENCVKYTNPSSHELDMVFTFHHLKTDYKDGNKWELQPLDFIQLKKYIFQWQSALCKEDGWNALFWNNHDQPRSLSRFGDEGRYWKESATMLATCIHLLRGTPYVYQGEELGMTNAGFTRIEQYEDIESRNMYDILLNRGISKNEVLHILQQRSRDNSRTPMQWTPGIEAGFTSGDPWLSVNPNHVTINAESQVNDPSSIFTYYKHLIALRHEMPIIQKGDIQSLYEDDPHIFGYKRCLKDDELIVLCNFDKCETMVKLPSHEDYELLLSNYEAVSESCATETPHESLYTSSVIKDNVILRPYEALVCIKKR